ncbi:MBT domain-containing protein 1, partial [Nibea albiflora]
SSLTLIKTNGQVYTYPDGKAGMATCEMCGMVGIRDAFYSKTKRFCSVSCSRSYSSNSKKASILARLQGKPPTKKAKVLQKQPLMTKLAAYAQHQANQHGGVKKSVTVEVFDWGRYLGDGDVMGAPVSCFKHVPMGKSWGDISEGVRVEVPNTDSGLPMKVYWIAGIIKLAGFKALLRYEGFDSDSTRDFWLNLCVPDIHPVQDSMQVPFKKQMRVEVVDKTHLCRTRVALVEQECEDGSDDFWCHMYSPLIHSIGWSRSIGHRFKRSDVSKKLSGQMDAPGQLFAKVKEVDQSSSWFEDGMKLEAIDPLNLSAICVATVRKVLADGYLMIGIDGSEAADGSDWFCYHSTSPSIFPSGFCCRDLQSAASKQRKKSQQYKGQKKKRKLPIAKRPVSLSGAMVTGVPRSLSGDENETSPDYPSPPTPASAAQPASIDPESSPSAEGGAEENLDAPGAETNGSSAELCTSQDQ